MVQASDTGDSARSSSITDEHCARLAVSGKLMGRVKTVTSSRERASELYTCGKGLTNSLRGSGECHGYSCFAIPKNCDRYADTIRRGISLFYNLELVKKSVFQPPTTKPGNIGPRTGKTVRITPSITVASCFEGGFATVAFPNFWNFTPLN